MAQNTELSAFRSTGVTYVFSAGNQFNTNVREKIKKIATDPDLQTQRGGFAALKQFISCQEASIHGFGNNDKISPTTSEIEMKNTVIISDKPIVEVIKDFMALAQPGYINVDFTNVDSIGNNINKAIITTAIVKGSERIADAIGKLYDSMIWNKDEIQSAKSFIIKILFSRDSCNLLSEKELSDIFKFTSSLPPAADVKWTVNDDPSMGDCRKLILFASC